jgi:hypothetical protein
MTTLENLAWACSICNLLKGPETAAIDVSTGNAAKFFNPRTQIWHEHFALLAGHIVGLTPEGRVTEQLLQFNRADLIKLRCRLIALSRYPVQSKGESK